MRYFHFGCSFDRLSFDPLQSKKREKSNGVMVLELKSINSVGDQFTCQTLPFQMESRCLVLDAVLLDRDEC